MDNQYYLPDIMDIYPGYYMQVDPSIKTSYVTSYPLEVPEGFRDVIYWKEALIECPVESNNVATLGLNNTVFVSQCEHLRRGVNSNWVNASSIYLHHANKHIRVPYLTKDQITAAGWEFIRDIELAMGGWQFICGNYTLKYYHKAHLISIWCKPYKTHMFNADKNICYIFQAKCPSVNEFRKILNMLPIEL